MSGLPEICLCAPGRSDTPRAPRRLDHKPRSFLCKGKTALGKKCRNRTYAGYCHLHIPTVTDAEPSAVTINI